MVTEEANKEWTKLMEEEIVTVDAPSSYMGPGEILNTPTTDAPLPLRVTDLAFKGHVQVWNTKTGVMKVQPRWLLWQTMAKKHPDGSPLFTLTDPKIPQNHGAELFCPFNPMSPEYQEMKGMGFKDCRKQHIPHLDGLMSHVRKSHKRGWDAMERKRLERERAEDRQSRKELTEAIKLAVVGGVKAGVNSPFDGFLQVEQEESLPLETITTTNAADNIVYVSAAETTREDHVLEPELIDRIQLSPNDDQWKEILPHTHLYRGKKAGAACKTEGCGAVRRADVKPHAKKT